MIKPKKHLGQHFLHDKRIAEKIASLVADPPEGYLIEVGPGTGALTNYLLLRGFSVTAIEKDTEAIEYLAKHFSKNTKLTVIQNDILLYDFQSLTNSILVGNLPYNISGSFFFELASAYSKIQQGVFMIQYEVAQRLISRPKNKNYGILSVLLGYGFEISIAFTVGPGAFSPPPKVTSAVVVLKQRKTIPTPVTNWKDFCMLVKQAFSQRRKMLRNTLPEHQFTLPENLKQCRAEELSINDFVSLANTYTERALKR
ncbi:MAG: 16S rRNA (adenine(1518)-N(6)/adenine(1519)-N(6))-dimethyltransferase RsmA [Bacteroidia bacterium]|nr:16S rRNA (adenine(1518)-N(6)/adenine(1519)-N(6))-dimethyltransferase RsmA [Bacteroidia bacterium]